MFHLINLAILLCTWLSYITYDNPFYSLLSFFFHLLLLHGSNTFINGLRVRLGLRMMLASITYFPFLYLLDNEIPIQSCIFFLLISRYLSAMAITSNTITQLEHNRVMNTVNSLGLSNDIIDILSFLSHTLQFFDSLASKTPLYFFMALVF